MFIRTILASVALPLVLFACGAPAEDTGEQGSAVTIKKCTYCPPLPPLPTCGGSGQPGCGSQSLSCNPGLVPSFRPQAGSSTNWIPAACLSSGSVSASLIATPTLDSTNTNLIVSVLASAMGSDEGPVDVPFVLRVQNMVSGVSAVYGPYIPTITHGNAAMSFTVPACETYTITMSSLQGQDWTQTTVNPPISILDLQNGQCCQDQHMYMPCSEVVVVSGSSGGSASGSGAGAGGGASGGNTWCQPPILCSQNCVGYGTFPLGYFCDEEDAAAAANNGCDVECQ